MDKEQLRSEILKLNETEKKYQKDPSLSQVYYTPDYLNRIQRGIYPALPGESDTGFQSRKHGKLIENMDSVLYLPDIRISKQTRYSIVPLHRHSMIEINYVYHDSCTVNLNGQMIALRTGDVCILNKDVIHTIEPLQEEDIVINFQISSTRCNRHMLDSLSGSGPIANFLFNAMSTNTSHNHYLMFHTDEVPSVKELYESLLCEYLDPALCSEEAVYHYLQLLMICFARGYQFSTAQEYHSRCSLYIPDVLQYMENHYKDCTLKETAEHFGFNTRYLSKAVEKATGFSFKVYLDQIRLKRASAVIAHTDQPIESIASDCGWTNLSQFYRKFEAYYHCRPGDYRRQKKG